MRLKSLFTPGVLFALPLAASLLVWAIPGSGLYLRGFDRRSSFNFGSATVLFGWYVTCFLFILVGSAIGRAVPVPAAFARAERSPLFERRFYAFLTMFAVVGVLGAYYLIAREVSIVQAVTSSQANELSSVLLDGSSVATLRYAVIVSAPVGIYLAIERKASWFVAGVNVVLLLAVVLLSSRLSLIMATVIFVFLYAHSRPQARIRLWPTIGAAAVLFGLLAVFNYSRNANFYRLFGVDNPLVMNLFQIAAYVGSPSQVSVGVADAVFGGRLSVSDSLGSAAQAIVPTFLQTVKGDRSAVTDEGLYGYQVDIAPNLNSNSAFGDTYAHFGWWGLVFTLIVLAIASVFFSHLAQYRSVLSVGSAALGYGFLEYWRTFFFNQGSMVFLLIVVFLSAFAALAMSSRRSYELADDLTTDYSRSPQGVAARDARRTVRVR